MREQENPEPEYTRFRIDDDSSDDSTAADVTDVLETDPNDNRIRALNRRVTVVSMLLFCLVVMVTAAAYVAYIDVGNRFESLTQSNTAETRVLVKTLEKRLDAMDTRYTQLEFSLDKILPALSKTTTSIKDSLGKTRKNLQTALDLKADKKMVAASDKRFEKIVSEIPSEIQTLRNDYQTLRGDLDRKLEGREDLDRKLADIQQTADDLAKQWEQSRSETKAFLDHKADNKTLQAAIRKLRTDVRKDLNPLLKRIAVKEKRLASIEDKVRILERRLKTDFRNTPANQLSRPASGNISEQAIPE